MKTQKNQARPRRPVAQPNPSGSRNVRFPYEKQKKTKPDPGGRSRNQTFQGARMYDFHIMKTKENQARPRRPVAQPNPSRSRNDFHMKNKRKPSQTPEAGRATKPFREQKCTISI